MKALLVTGIAFGLFQKILNLSIDQLAGGRSGVSIEERRAVRLSFRDLA
jgi:hypothetical protein